MSYPQRDIFHQLVNTCFHAIVCTGSPQGCFTSQPHIQPATCLLFIHGSAAPCFRVRLTWCFCRGVTVLPHPSSNSSMQAWVLSKDVQAGRVGATEVHMFKFKPNPPRMHELLHKSLFQRNISCVFVRLLREQQNSICSLETLHGGWFQFSWYLSVCTNQTPLFMFIS